MRLLGLLLAAAVLTACAPGYKTKAGGLEPFGERGITETAEVRRVALIVGIDAFDDERFNPLDYPDDDARAVAAALHDFDEIEVLIGPKKTTRASILSALRATTKKASGPGDIVFVYFSTHGTLAPNPSGAPRRVVVASDTRLDVPGETGIYVDDIVAELERSRSRRTALVLATCHSGIGKSRLGDELSAALAEEKGIAPLEVVSEAAVVASAASFGEAARENDRLGHDVYTHFFLEAFVLGDRNEDGAVTLTEAHDWARERTYAFTDGAQRPTIVSAILGTDPLVLTGQRERSGKPLLYSYAPSAEGVVVAVDGNEKGRLPGGIALEPGRHRVTLKEHGTDRNLWSGTVRLDEGERVDISELLDGRTRLIVEAVGSADFPLQSDVRGRFLADAWGGGARIAAENLLFRYAYAELTFLAAYGGSTTPSVVGNLDYDFTSTQAFAGLGASLPVVSRVTTNFGVRGGVYDARRSLSNEAYRDTEHFLAPSVGAFGALRYRPWRFLTATVRFDARAIRARLGDERWAILGAPSVTVGATF